MTDQQHDTSRERARTRHQSVESLREFPPLGFQISLTGKDAYPLPRSLHSVSEDARLWDATSARFALYSDNHNYFGYVNIRITGREVRWVTNRGWAIAVRVDFLGDGDESLNCKAIMMRPGGDLFERDTAKAILSSDDKAQTRAYFDFLDRLRLRGETNMFGAAPYLRQKWPALTRTEAQTVLADWMKQFDARVTSISTEEVKR